MLNRELLFKIEVGETDDRFHVTLEDAQQHIITELKNTAASEAAIVSLFKSFGTTFFSNVVDPYKKEQEAKNY